MRRKSVPVAVARLRDRRGRRGDPFDGGDIDQPTWNPWYPSRAPVDRLAGGPHRRRHGDQRVARRLEGAHRHQHRRRRWLRPPAAPSGRVVRVGHRTPRPRSARPRLPVPPRSLRAGRTYGRGGTTTSTLRNTTREPSRHSRRCSTSSSKGPTASGRSRRGDLFRRAFPTSPQGTTPAVWPPQEPSFQLSSTLI